jgi:hypothetical protein
MKQLLLLLLLLISATVRGEYKEPVYPLNFAMTLSRTACFGRCPVYRATVEANGVVVFEPEEFTHSSERQTLTLPPIKVWQLIGALERAWFFERPAAYEPGKASCKRARYSTDHSGFEISASLEKKKKRVRVDTGCLEVDHTLIVLPEQLESILGIEGFIYGKKP